MARGFGMIGLMCGVCLLAGSPVRASCGLDQCPVPGFGQAPESWAVSATTRYTAVQKDSWYLEQFVGLQRRLGPIDALGLITPIVHNAQGSESMTGLGNLVAYGEWQPISGKKVGRGFHGALGLQLEMPTSQDDALGDGHFLLMPYGRLAYVKARWDLRSQLGWGQSLSGGHHHHHHHHGHEDHGEPHHGDQSLPAVNPHSSSELLFRTSLGLLTPSKHGQWRLGLGLDGVQELVDAQRLLLQMQVAMGWTASHWGLNLVTDLPVTEARRWDGRLKVGLQRRF